MEDSEIIGGFEALFGAMSPEQEARITAYLRARIDPAPKTRIVAGQRVPADMPSPDAVARYIDHLSECSEEVWCSVVAAIQRGVFKDGYAQGVPVSISVSPRPAPPKTLPSADDVVAWLNAQDGELPDAVTKAIAAATIRCIKAKYPPATIPFPPPTGVPQGIPHPGPLDRDALRHLEDWFRRNPLPQEPHGFGKQWVGVAVGTTTGDSSIAQQPPATQTIGDNKHWVVHGGFPVICGTASVDNSVVDHSQVVNVNPNTDDRLAGITAPYSDDVGPIGGVFK